jgi:hypothetical protein
LGQGDLVREEINALRASGRFVSPEEIHALIEDWVDNSGFGADTLKSTGNPSIWDLSLSQGKIGRIRDRMQRQRRHDPAAYMLINRIQNEGHAWCTFDGEVAQAQGNLPFLDLNHPITRVAYDDALADFPGDPFLRVGFGALTESWLPTRGVFLFLID